MKRRRRYNLMYADPGRESHLKRDDNQLPSRPQNTDPDSATACRHVPGDLGAWGWKDSTSREVVANLWESRTVVKSNARGCHNNGSLDTRPNTMHSQDSVNRSIGRCNMPCKQGIEQLSLPRGRDTGTTCDGIFDGFGQSSRPEQQCTCW